ncbi:DNA-binding NarL/FixJ family response regulator [Salirhabdus euzebyi]|uniref:DNA-binding NarL/FixJ family response regulator n=1 Tax=Salirhabdus euzebyi TaxID=394506 RepID=A0A841Q7I3_9BACI|nr:hypothetical protein [Salirhabdus euzebyi]MBB6454277.1 DNA-binding NarL/FixJ family response regulator [Salirhabdus euzebyi]
MFSTIITLLLVGLSLFILSYFTNDRLKELEEQVEQLSISSLQETYKMKSKIKILEEELLSDVLDTHFDTPATPKAKEQPPLLKQIKALYDQGLSTDKIAQQTSLQEHDVRAILHQIYPKTFN